MKIHQEKVRKHKCRFCDYNTYAKPQLVEHERTHTGEKPEICSYCAQGFSSKKTLRNHERLHTGERPFKCRFCDSAFAQRTSLNVHVQTHHKEVAAAGLDKVRAYDYHKKPGRSGGKVPKTESVAASSVSSPGGADLDGVQQSSEQFNYQHHHLQMAAGLNNAEILRRFQSQFPYTNQ